MYSAANTVFNPAAAESVINQKGLHRKYLFDTVKASSKRLQLEYIGVLQCHRFDYTTPIEETVSAEALIARRGDWQPARSTLITRHDFCRCKLRTTS